MRMLLVGILLFQSGALLGQAIGFRVTSNLAGDQNLYTGKANVIEMQNTEGPVTIKARHGLVQMLDQRSFIVIEPYKMIPESDSIYALSNRSKRVIGQNTFRV